MWSVEKRIYHPLSAYDTLSCSNTHCLSSPISYLSSVLAGDAKSQMKAWGTNLANAILIIFLVTGVKIEGN